LLSVRVEVESPDISTACERGELHHIRNGGRRSIRLKPGMDRSIGGSSVTPAKRVLGRRRDWSAEAESGAAGLR
jgi:hypothetical protein